MTMPSRQPDGAVPRRLRRVLLVDDDPAVLAVVGQALRAAGFEVETAPDGEEALKLLSDVTRPVPDAIVTDGQMPRRSGPELLRQISPDPRFHAVRTILMSSGAMAGDNVHCHAFMAKPRVPHELIDTLVRLESATQSPDTAAAAPSNPFLQFVDPLRYRQLVELERH